MKNEVKFVPVSITPAAYRFERVGKGKNIMLETGNSRVAETRMVKVIPKDTYELYNENYCPHCHMLLPLNGKCDCGYEAKGLVIDKEILTQKQVKELRQRLGTSSGHIVKETGALDEIQKEINKLLAQQVELMRRKVKV